MTTKGGGIRRKKSSLSEVKIAIVGSLGVGKSALVVRFLTKRYIGEYDHLTENRYRHEAMVDNEPVLFEILDTCPKADNMDVFQWADGILFVYSITDRESFNFIRKVKDMHADRDTPVLLLANKVDMIHLRQISTEEGEILAKNFECKFFEVSAAENVEKVAESFHDLCREVLASKRKSKQSLLDRMLGTTRAYSRGKSDSSLPKD